MILTPYNCTSPWMWGKDMKFFKDGRMFDPTEIIKVDVPQEFDFINQFIPCDKDPLGAREYIKCLLK